MTLTVGQTLTHYEILAPLGAGAMGEVWRASDTRLEREVAIKVLPEHFAEDEERLRRFEREAKVLASLNHTNVAGIHGIDQVGDTCFLAMELVPGEDLEARLRRGALPLDEALDVGRQIAEGLEAAHEAGVVHRDLKPANVRITPEGVVKLLDFGLAKPLRPESGTGGASSVLSDSVLATSEGMILGTPTYMSPEQARGRPVDRRTDVWAFGCVLYECLTGKRAFEGEAFGELVAAILEREADLAALPAATPPRVRELIARCLAKDPRQRLRDVGEARILLSGRSETSAAHASPASPASTGSPKSTGSPRRFPVLPWAVAALAMAAAAYGLLRGATNPEPARDAPRQQVRFAIRHPGARNVSLSNPVVAPDGSYVAYLALEGSDSRLWVRDLDAREARALPGTEAAGLPFVSPDGRYLGFFAGGRIKKVAVTGGAPVDVCPVTGGPGAAWTEEGWILFSMNWTTGLSRVRAEGGPVEELTTPDAEAGETGHWWPEPLPGGERVLYTVYTSAGTLNRARIALLDLTTGRSRTLCEGAQPILLGSSHLLYFRAGAYEVAPFDVERGELTGPPETVREDVPPLHAAGTQERFLHVSRSGVLAYLARRNDQSSSPRSWFRMDRSGALEPLTLPPTMSADPDLSPDGRYLAMVGEVEGEIDVFVHDLTRGTELRLTTESVNDRPQWSPDGTRLVFDSIKLGTYDVFEADPSGVRGVWPLFTREVDVFGGGLIAGTEELVVQMEAADGRADIYRVDPSSGSAEPVVVAPGGESNVRVSPDGRFVAYDSAFSGRGHVYVAPLSGDGGPVKASRGGGSHPHWTDDGVRLAFTDGSDLLVVDVDLQDGHAVIGEAESFVEGGLPEDVSRRFTGQFAISGDGASVILGLLDEPVRAELEVVLDGPAVLGAR